MKYITKHMRNRGVIHEYQKIKFFACALYGDVENWFSSPPDNRIGTMVAM